MIDVSNIKYNVILVTSKGKQYDIKDYIEDLGWEESVNEISMRLTFSCRNDKTSKGYLQSLITPGCLVVVTAVYGKKKQEVARGYVTVWNPVLKNDSDAFKCTCYDELYNLQKSQENRYFSKGTGTKAAIKKIFKDWKVTLGKYSGPNVKHGKKKFSSKYLSDIILEFLDDAVKKGKPKCVIRASAGKVSILPYGNNGTVYVFDKDNITSVDYSKSIADLVTRVRVMSKVDDKGKSKVQATVNGLTKYGIRQRIYTRGTDESLKDAKTAAKEILNENGSVKLDITLNTPDVPFIRKGDVVYVKNAKVSTGYYHVTGIRHDADTASMTMNLEHQEKDKVTKQKVVKQKGYATGDIVDFKGGKYYVSSKNGAKGSSAKAGRAKIKKISSGAGHPYYLVHKDKKSKVNGWVDKSTFE